MADYRDEESSGEGFDGKDGKEVELDMPAFVTLLFPLLFPPISLLLLLSEYSIFYILIII